MYSSNITHLYLNLVHLYTICGFDKLLPRFFFSFFFFMLIPSLPAAEACDCFSDFQVHIIQLKVLLQPNVDLFSVLLFSFWFFVDKTINPSLSTTRRQKKRGFKAKWIRHVRCNVVGNYNRVCEGRNSENRGPSKSVRCTMPEAPTDGFDSWPPLSVFPAVQRREINCESLSQSLLSLNQL